LRIVAFPTPPPRILAASVSGTNMIFAATNGVPGGLCAVLTSTNLGLPTSQWRVVATNAFDVNGGLIFTNPIDPLFAQTFYQLRLLP